MVCYCKYVACNREQSGAAGCSQAIIISLPATRATEPPNSNANRPRPRSGGERSYYKDYYMKVNSSSPCLPVALLLVRHYTLLLVLADWLAMAEYHLVAATTWRFWSVSVFVRCFDDDNADICLWYEQRADVWKIAVQSRRLPHSARDRERFEMFVISARGSSKHRRTLSAAFQFD